MPIESILAQQAASQGISMGMGLLQSGLNDQRQIKQQGVLNDMAKSMYNFQMQKQLEMWEKTNYKAQKEQMKKAGLNPALLYGMSGGGGASMGGASMNASQAPSGGGELTAAMGMGLQLAAQKAQIENIQANTSKTKAEEEKLKGVDTENVKADTANKVLQQVITEYSGKEAKDVYERVTSPNRSVQAKTYQDELEARQGIAGTIYEMWQEGKLKDKSVAEVEQLLLQNAKTREETRKIYKDMEMLEENIKGAKLDNIMRELETKLQTQTGIDKNSPAWMKVLGRLFVELFNK